MGMQEMREMQGMLHDSERCRTASDRAGGRTLRAAAGPWLLSLLLMIGAAGCSERGAARAADSAGPDGAAVNVTLPGGLAIRELFRIGSVDGSDETTTFGRIGAVEVDASGRVYALDSRAQIVRVYGPDGDHLHDIGRPGGGSGPGEFRSASGLLIASDGRLWVLDVPNERYSAFTADGELDATHRRSFSAGVGRWEPTQASDRRIYEPTSIRHPRTNEIESVFLGLAPTGDDMSPVDTVRRLSRLPVATWPVRGQTAGGAIVESGNLPIPFSVTRHDHFDPRGDVWEGTTDALRFVRRSRAGDTLQIVERADVEPERATAADRATVIAELNQRFGGEQGFDEGDMPAHMPLWTSFFVDPVGRLWVHRYVRPTEQVVGEGRWEVHATDGEFIGAVTLPLVERPRPVVRGNRLVGITRDELGVEYPVVFELVDR